MMSNLAIRTGKVMKRKMTAVLLFVYGLAVGTAGPLVLGRCVSSGTGCGTCGGFCVLSLSVLPLLIFLALTGRLKKYGVRILAWLRGQDKAKGFRDA